MRMQHRSHTTRRPTRGVRVTSQQKRSTYLLDELLDLSLLSRRSSLVGA